MGNLAGFFLIDAALYLLNQAHHIAHTQNPGHDPVCIESLQRRRLLTDAEELDRFAGHFAHRQRGPASGIAIRLGQDHTGQLKSIVECTRARNSILACHAVHHKQRFNRVNRGVQGLEFAHHVAIDVEPACCINNDHIVRTHPGLGQRMSRYLNGLRSF